MWKSVFYWLSNNAIVTAFRKKHVAKSTPNHIRKKPIPIGNAATAIYTLKNTKYSSIYIVVTFFFQSFGLEFLKDVTSKIQDQTTSELIYSIGGLVLIVLLLRVCDIFIKRAKKQIEGQCEKMDIKTDGTSNKVDWIIEWATTIGYLSPLLYLSAWVSHRSVLGKWGVLALVFIMGIVLPYIIKQKINVSTSDTNYHQL